MQDILGRNTHLALQPPVTPLCGLSTWRRRHDIIEWLEHFDTDIPKHLDLNGAKPS
jgi:hypothetical protein